MLHPDEYECGAEGPATTGIDLEFSIQKLRLMGEVIRKDTGGFTTEQVRAFLILYRDDIEALVTKTIRDFLRRKLGE